jgi:hypothetical protein
MAAPSLCAHLPEAGRVSRPAADALVPAKPAPNRRLGCPPGHRLDMVARPPMCRKSAQESVDGNPRAACLASLEIGPVADVPAQWRPTRSCPTNPIVAQLRLEGRNLGLADVTVTSRSGSVRVTSIDDNSSTVPAAERPAAQGCFAHACRMVQLEITAEAPLDGVRLELAVKGGASTDVLVPLDTHCPDPLARRPGVGLRRANPAPPAP